jgi:hypothetical protein
MLLCLQDTVCCNMNKSTNNNLCVMIYDCVDRGFVKRFYRTGSKIYVIDSHTNLRYYTVIEYSTSYRYDPAGGIKFGRAHHLIACHSDRRCR